MSYLHFCRTCERLVRVAFGEFPPSFGDRHPGTDIQRHHAMPARHGRNGLVRQTTSGDDVSDLKRVQGDECQSDGFTLHSDAPPGKFALSVGGGGITLRRCCYRQTRVAAAFVKF